MTFPTNKNNAVYTEFCSIRSEDAERFIVQRTAVTTIERAQVLQHAAV